MQAKFHKYFNIILFAGKCLTGQFGLVIGAIAGLMVYFVSIGQITFTPAPTDVVIAAKNLIRTLAIGSTILTFLVYARKKSFFSTTVDGFITGFAAIIDLITFMG
jgi:magnesium-transporting ATPase (P-type)